MSFSALTLLLGDRRADYPACKKLLVRMLMVTICLELCTSYSYSPQLPSSLASAKSRLIAFWYQLTRVFLKMAFKRVFLLLLLHF